MSIGGYNPTYFKNHPEVGKQPGVLYCVVLVNKKTYERETVKIGITKGTNFRDAIKRSMGFKGYEIRIQKLVKGPLEEIFYLENYLHELWQDESFRPSVKFAGHTECFNIEMLPEILKSIPDKP